ncbi:AraC family transcriptional regulator [Psychrobacter sp. T6-5]|uniref:AraC family transcriptional regulator n=1 Tax=Psychrobacter sp. T6-5 TaxID=3457451 RepID=UPI003FD675E2
MRHYNQKDWYELNRDPCSRIETIRAHFTGHAYDPHWHDSYLIGVTEQGVQQFKCRAKQQVCVPGTSFLLDPEEIHDGTAPSEDGFTYRMLFISPELFQQRIRQLFPKVPDNFEFRVNKTLSQDNLLSASISSAFAAIHYQEPKIIQDACLDQMMKQLTEHMFWRKTTEQHTDSVNIALLTQEILHANLNVNIGLTEIAETLKVNRFHLTRSFKAIFGLAPHAYLIQLRLVRARELLAHGENPADVANKLCFSDQSHMGRWFKRCYRFTPAEYQRRTFIL